MGDMATFTCRVCRHEQTIYWGGGFFTYNRNNLADRIRDPELSRDVRLILQQEDAVVERVVKMAIIAHSVIFGTIFWIFNHYQRDCSYTKISM